MGAKFSSGGGATVFYDKTDTPGEIVTELVNASDGAGLHFDGVAGGIDLGSSMPDLGTQYSLEFIVNGDSKTGETYLLDAYKSGARIIFGWSGYSNGNIQLHINGTWSNAFIATPDNGEVVHLLLSVDGTSATLYQNGNAVSTQTVVANTMTSATSTRIGCSQNGTGNFFNGTIYRARFYNRALSSTEVQTAYEHASVVQNLRWGDSKILNGTAWTGASGTTPPTSWTAGITGVFTIDSSSGSGNEPSLKITRSSNNPYIYQTFTSVVGRRYRVRYRVKNIDATNVIVGIGSTAGPSEEYNQSTYTSTSWANYEATFTATTVNFGVYVQVSTTTGTQSGYIDSLEVFEDSLASDYDLAFANPTQSLMVQDRTGEADGTATATGVTQVQPVVQLNSTSARIGTVVGNPPDGELYVSSRARIGQYSTQGGAILGVRNQGDSINFGHNNSAGYGSTIGCGVSNGWPHLALMCEAGTNVNTFKTRGLSGNVIYATNTGELRFGQVTTADADNQTVTDRLTISSTGQVAIGGVTSPDGTLHVHTASAGTVTADTDRDDLVIENSANVGMTFLSPNTNKQEIAFGDPENSRMGLITYNHDDDSLAFKVNNVSDRLKISSNGQTFFNCTSVPNASVQGFAIHGSSSANVSSSGSSTSSYNHFNIFNGNGQVGSIVSSGSATAFNTSSDYRLKENLEPLTGALDRLDALPVYRFNFKADPDTTVDGFVAHEVSAHVPEAVTGEKDAMKTVVVQEAVEAVEAVDATYWEEGDELPEGVAVGDEKTAAVEAVEAVAEVTEEQIDPQGIDQSKLVPLLVAAVKELKAKVETLENS